MNAQDIGLCSHFAGRTSQGNSELEAVILLKGHEESQSEFHRLVAEAADTTGSWGLA